MAEAFAGAYNDGGVRYQDALNFFGIATDRAPAWMAGEYQGARDLLNAGSGPEVAAFRERFARDAFLETAARAQNGLPGPTSMQSAFALNLLADGAGGNAAVGQLFRSLSPEQQRAVAAELGHAAEGYGNSAGAIPGLHQSLDTLVAGLSSGTPVPPRTAPDGTIEITVTHDPADTPAERQVLLNVADGLQQSRYPGERVQAALTDIHRRIDDGIATQRERNPDAYAQALARVNDANTGAQRVFASLPPNASKDQIYAAITANYDAIIAPTFSQYLELRGDAARELSGPALRNEIGLAMGMAPNHAPQTPEQQAAMDRGEWDFFTGNEATAIRAVEAQIAEVGGPGARVAALPVTVTSEQIGGVVQVPLFRVETTDGQTRFVDFNPATGEARQYSSFQDWRENNKLPPGRMSFPQDGHLTAGVDGKPRIITENTPGTVDTFWERWGQPVLDGAALVGGVVLIGAAIVGTGGTALVVGGALLGAYGAYRGGEVIVDRATHGQTVNPLENAEARNAWLNIGASAVGFAAAGASLRAASAAGRTVSGLDDAANALRLANNARTLNVAAQYADTAAFVDTGYSLAANWDKLTPQQQLGALAQMAFWGGGTAVAARQSGGLSNLYGVGDMSAAMSQANQWIRSQVPEGYSVQQVLTHVTDAVRNGLPRGFEIRQITTPEGVTLHAIVARNDGSGGTSAPRTGTDTTTTTGLRTDLRTEFPNAQRVTLDNRGLFNGVDNAGPNAPLFQRWLDRGGEVYYDRVSDTYVYAITMETRGNPGTMQRVEVPYRLDANGNRRADFSAYSTFNTSIDPNLAADRALHFREANRDLTAAMEANPALRGRLGLSDDVYRMVTKEPPDGRSPSPFTWHHVDGGGRMMLVDQAIHQRFSHFGGFSEWGL